MNNLIDSNNIDNNIWKIIIIVIIFIFFIRTYNENYYNQETFTAFTTEAAGQGISNIGVCSKSCCYSGWPSSVVIDDGLVNQADIGTKYRTTNYTCSNGATSVGCICELI